MSTSPRPLQPRDLSSEYHLGDAIGSGSSGDVREAQQVAAGRTVAVKRWRGLVTATAWDRFAQEATTMARVAHANIVPVLAHGEIDGRPAVVMERIDGLDLHAILTKLRASGGSASLRGLEAALGGCALPWPRNLPWERAVARIGTGLARALDHVHRHGVLHRDVKPSNILLARTGTAQLVDFGTAAYETSSIEEAEANSDPEVGTLLYSAPEHLSGEPSTARSDVYSLGLCLAELASLKASFPAGDSASVASAVLGGEPASVSAVRDRSLRAVLARATALDPARRYAGAGDLARDLERFAAARPVHCQPESVVSRLIRGAALRRASILAGLVFLGTAGAVPAVLSAKELRSAKNMEAAAAAADEHLNGAIEALSDTLVDTVAFAMKSQPFVDRKRERLLTMTLDLVGDLEALAPESARTDATALGTLKLGALTGLGSVRFELGQLDAAESALEEAAAVAAELPFDAQEAAASQQRYAKICIAHARQQWDTVEDLGQIALGESPEDIGVQALRLRVASILIESAIVRGLPELAVERGEESLEEARVLLDGHPESLERRLVFSRVVGNYAVALIRLGRYAEALDEIGEVPDLLADCGTSAEACDLLATHRGNVATIARAQGNAEDAVDGEREALALQVRLAASFPDKVALQLAVGRTEFHLAESIAMAGGSVADVREALSMSMGTLDRIEAQFGAAPGVHGLRTMVYEFASRLAIQTRQLDEAVLLLDEAIRSLELCTAVPGGPDQRTILRRRLLSNRVTLRIRKQSPEDAAVELAEFLSLLPGDAEAAWHAGKMQAVLATKAEQGGSATPEEVEALRDAAVEYLLLARELGLPNPSRLLTDPSLTAIRERLR